MKKSIEIWNKRLEISKEGAYYMINNSELNLFIHADKLKLKRPNNRESWLSVWHKDDYIGSLWVASDTDMKKVRKFLEETK